MNEDETLLYQKKAERIRMNDDDEKIKSSWMMLFILRQKYTEGSKEFSHINIKA